MGPCFEFEDTSMKHIENCSTDQMDLTNASCMTDWHRTHFVYVRCVWAQHSDHTAGMTKMNLLYFNSIASVCTDTTGVYQWIYQQTELWKTDTMQNKNDKQYIDLFWYWWLPILSCLPSPIQGTYSQQISGLHVPVLSKHTFLQVLLLYVQANKPLKIISPLKPKLYKLLGQQIEMLKVNSKSYCSNLQLCLHIYIVKDCSAQDKKG